MQVNSINANNTNFKAKLEEDSEKTNSGKILGAGLAIGMICEKASISGGLSHFVDSYRDDIEKNLGEECFNNTSRRDSMKITTNFFNNMAKSNMMGSIILTLATCIGAGAIYDWFANSGKKESGRKHV